MLAGFVYTYGNVCMDLNTTRREWIWEASNISSSSLGRFQQIVRTSMLGTSHASCVEVSSAPDLEVGGENDEFSTCSGRWNLFLAPDFWQLECKSCDMSIIGWIAANDHFESRLVATSMRMAQMWLDHMSKCYPKMIIHIFATFFLCFWYILLLIFLVL